VPIKEKIEKIKILFANWQARLLARQGRLNKRGIIVTLAAALVLLGLILVIINMGGFKVKKEVPLLPSPSPTPTEEIFAPSSYATDSAVLAIEEDIDTLEEDLLKTDLYETGLNPPVLDMKVEFRE